MTPNDSFIVLTLNGGGGVVVTCVIVCRLSHFFQTLGFIKADSRSIFLISFPQN